MARTSVRALQVELVRDRVLDAVCDLIAAGGEATFARVAVAADVPERMV
jgi:hypothetical protein